MKQNNLNKIRGIKINKEYILIPCMIDNNKDMYQTNK